MSDGGPAFPIDRPGYSETWSDSQGGGGTYYAPVQHNGMTLRDYFAAHAPAYPFQLPILDPFNDDDGPMATVAKSIARWQFAYADAVLARRNK